MVIQRWQSLFLLVAVIIMGCLCFSPLAVVPASQSVAESTIYLSDYIVLMVVDILVSALLFISIFLFKDLKLQMKVTLLSIVLICVLAVGGGFYLWHNSPDAVIELSGAALLLLLAAIFAVCAYRFMRRDYRLLRSVDRFR